ncbi:competence type IV pilus minor pilin ComGD [Alkalihalobacillus sp. NPDC078783]
MNEQGYTLIEMLITLTLLSVLTILPMLAFSNVRETHESEYVSWQLKQDLILAQQLAMARGEITLVLPTEKAYHIRLLNRESYLERPYATSDMQIRPLSLTGPLVMFNRVGNPRYAGTISLRTNRQHYIYTLHLGKGRIRYSKQT